MAMELFVLSDRRLSSIAEWQGAIDAEGFALRLSDATPFESVDGFLPARLEGRQTGFECAHWDAATLMSEAEGVEFDRAWTQALSFRWGGNFDEGDAAFMAAAAYARATGGIILDWDNSRVLTAEEMKSIALASLQSRPELEVAVRRLVDEFRKQP
jgi:hypothetical protein